MPNALLLMVVVPVVIMLAVTGHGPLQVETKPAVIAALVGLVPALLGYLINQVGAGDVKYVVVLGLLVGIAGMLEILFWSALAIGMLSLAALAVARWKDAPVRKVPAALALSAAFAVCLAER